MKLTNKPSFEIRATSSFIEFMSPRSTVATNASAFLYLLSHRQDKDEIFKMHNKTCSVKAGQAVVPITHLSLQWKWDRKRVRRFLQKLKDLGYIRYWSQDYWSIFEFPMILSPEDIVKLDRDSRNGTNAPVGNTSDAPAGIEVTAPPENTSEEMLSDLQKQTVSNTDITLPDIRFDAPPLSLDQQTSDQIHEIYEYLNSKLPKLEIPPYNDRTEKAICFLFVFGMKKDMTLMRRYIETVANDPYKNGEIAEMTGNSSDQESFDSLFACNWQELLFGTESI